MRRTMVMRSARSVRRMWALRREVGGVGLRGAMCMVVVWRLVGLGVGVLAVCTSCGGWVRGDGAVGSIGVGGRVRWVRGVVPFPLP